MGLCPKPHGGVSGHIFLAVDFRAWQLAGPASEPSLNSELKGNIKHKYNWE